MDNIQSLFVDNLEFISLLLGALAGALLVKRNALTLKDKITSILPGNVTASQSMAVGAILFGVLGYFIGRYLKDNFSGRGAFQASGNTYERLLPEDYYGMSSDMNPSTIGFAN